MDIFELSKKEYKGFEIKVNYQTKYYYEVKYKEKKDIQVTLKLRKFFFKQDKSFNIKLFEPYIEVSDCFAIFEKKKVVAIIEGELEEWHQRYRIWHLWVHPKHRGKGYASELLAHLEKVAVMKSARALILETQTCNYPAITLYKKHGFSFAGIDLTCYSNQDIKLKEVRLELGKSLL